MSYRTTTPELESIIASINTHFGFGGKRLWNRIDNRNVQAFYASTLEEISNRLNSL